MEFLLLVGVGLVLVVLLVPFLLVLLVLGFEVLIEVLQVVAFVDVQVWPCKVEIP